MGTAFRRVSALCVVVCDYSARRCSAMDRPVDELVGEMACLPLFFFFFFSLSYLMQSIILSATPLARQFGRYSSGYRDL
ncbi:hypothetical protein LMH87_004872 [Akanthomyces muscarius]|uniref:Uncharacterized protein n=1 Tax=Akanthomyces muscarius TaxID=2231603 RepID=A0A9W8Q6I5_AKAMU|nr:hypothetical protein LMH87_004872 [Akanthomyces muscarius]KAJ4146042.1 hypothetical protein LMH87_004872 [Akanthomyces muscarius]